MFRFLGREGPELGSTVTELNEACSAQLASLDAVILDACVRVEADAVSDETREIFLKLFECSVKVLPRVIKSLDGRDEAQQQRWITAANALFKMLESYKADEKVDLERSTVSCFVSVKDKLEVGPVMGEHPILLYETVLREWKRRDGDISFLEKCLALLPVCFTYQDLKAANEQQDVPPDEADGSTFENICLCIVDALQVEETSKPARASLIQLLKCREAQKHRTIFAQNGAIESFTVAIASFNKEQCLESEKALYWLVAECEKEEEPLGQDPGADEITAAISLDRLVDILNENEHENWKVALRVLCVLLLHQHKSLSKILKEAVNQVRLKVIRCLAKVVGCEFDRDEDSTILAIQILEALVEGQQKEELKVWEELAESIIRMLNGLSQQSQHEDVCLGKLDELYPGSTVFSYSESIEPIQNLLISLFILTWYSVTLPNGFQVSHRLDAAAFCFSAALVQHELKTGVQPVLADKKKSLLGILLCPEKHLLSLVAAKLRCPASSQLPARGRLRCVKMLRQVAKLDNGRMAILDHFESPYLDLFLAIECQLRDVLPCATYSQEDKTVDVTASVQTSCIELLDDLCRDSSTCLPATLCCKAVISCDLLPMLLILSGGSDGKDKEDVSNDSCLGKAEGLAKFVVLRKVGIVREITSLLSSKTSGRSNSSNATKESLQDANFDLSMLTELADVDVAALEQLDTKEANSLKEAHDAVSDWQALLSRPSSIDNLQDTPLGLAVTIAQGQSKEALANVLVHAGADTNGRKHFGTFSFASCNWLIGAHVSLIELLLFLWSRPKCIR